MGGPVLVIELAEAVPATVVGQLRGFLVGSSAWFEEKRPGGCDLNVLADTDRLGATDPGEVDRRRPLLVYVMGPRNRGRGDLRGRARGQPQRGEPITLQAVQREADVSHAFLYNHPDLRGRIERLRAQARPAAPAPPADKQSTLVLALTSQITRLKQQHREEVQALRDALEQAHGENLDRRRELARRGSDITPTQAHVIGPC
ncbi:DUF6368 family protein [Streptomyces mirabilis]|uniref:DUF6368 family protein n=1 Tax=Streptomyces mirabilis TaxID=68239 RepID=UPI0033C14015